MFTHNHNSKLKYFLLGVITTLILVFASTHLFEAKSKKEDFFDTQMRLMMLKFLQLGIDKTKKDLECSKYDRLSEV